MAGLREVGYLSVQARFTSDTLWEFELIRPLAPDFRSRDHDRTRFPSLAVGQDQDAESRGLCRAAISPPASAVPSISCLWISGKSDFLILHGPPIDAIRSSFVACWPGRTSKPFSKGANHAPRPRPMATRTPWAQRPLNRMGIYRGQDRRTAILQRWLAKAANNRFPTTATLNGNAVIFKPPV
jgi:hypothetical protein